MASISVDATITAQNQFTDWVEIIGGAVMTIQDVSSMGMTITLQCKQHGDTAVIDSDTQTTAGAWPIINGGGLYWRAGCKTGGYTSGSAKVQLSR